MKTLIRFIVILLLVSVGTTACEDSYQSVEEELEETTAVESLQNEVFVIEKKGCETCK